MKTRIAVVGILAAVIVATPALSTPGSGVTAPVLGRGVLAGPEKLKIRSDASDVVVQQLTIAPGRQLSVLGVHIKTTRRGAPQRGAPLPRLRLTGARGRSSVG